MTPQEEAKNLVNWYYENLPQWVNFEDAKICAKKSAEEAMKAEINVLIKFNIVKHPYHSDYWEQVLKEIDLL